MPKLPLTDTESLSSDWVNEPPIRKLEKSEIGPCGDWLTKAIKDWMSTGKPAKDGEADQERWNQRIEGGVERAEVIAAYGYYDGCDVYAYFYSGKPVGMMTIELEKSKEFGLIYIGDLAGHPGARNAGDLLIEYAVNLSQAQGTKGQVRLTALEGSYEFYASVGFKPMNGKWSPGAVGALLEPGSPQWSFLGERWKLTGLWNSRGNATTLDAIPSQRFRN
jgi:hypothetical protein